MNKVSREAPDPCDLALTDSGNDAGRPVTAAQSNLAASIMWCLAKKGILLSTSCLRMHRQLLVRKARLSPSKWERCQIVRGVVVGTNRDEGRSRPRQPVIDMEY